MALTDEQTAYFRRKLGTAVDLTDIETRLARLGQDEDAVVVEVQEQRYADALLAPTSFSIPGDYSESRAGQLEAMARGGAGGLSLVRIVPVDPPGYPIEVLDAEELYARGYRGGR